MSTSTDTTFCPNCRRTTRLAGARCGYCAHLVAATPPEQQTSLRVPEPTVEREFPREWKHFSAEQREAAIDRFTADVEHWMRVHAIPTEEEELALDRVGDAIDVARTRTGNPIISSVQIGEILQQYGAEIQSRRVREEEAARRKRVREQDETIQILAFCFVLAGAVAAWLIWVEPSIGAYVTAALGGAWAVFAVARSVRGRWPNVQGFEYAVLWSGAAACLVAALCAWMLSLYIIEHGFTLFSTDDAMQYAKNRRQGRGLLVIALAPLISLAFTSWATVTAALGVRELWSKLQRLKSSGLTASEVRVLSPRSPR
jgi:hypothetical protein